MADFSYFSYHVATFITLALPSCTTASFAVGHIALNYIHILYSTVVVVSSSQSSQNLSSMVTLDFGKGSHNFLRKLFDTYFRSYTYLVSQLECR